MASSISCAVCCSFTAADELAPADTLRVLRLHRLRRAAAGCLLDPIAEEDDDSDVDNVPAASSPRTYSSNSSSASLDRR
jgi:hypothetical protein